jgi:hypothetical protein
MAMTRAQDLIGEVTINNVIEREGPRRRLRFFQPSMKPGSSGHLQAMEPEIFNPRQG